MTKLGMLSLHPKYVLGIYVVKYVGLHVVTFLHRMPIFEWYVARILVKNKHRKKTLCDEIGLCGSESYMVESEHIWKGLCDHLKRTRIFTFTSYNFCISTLLILKLEMTIFVVCNC
jgi:hypothetical protein